MAKVTARKLMCTRPWCGVVEDTCKIAICPRCNAPMVHMKKGRRKPKSSIIRI